MKKNNLKIGEKYLLNELKLNSVAEVIDVKTQNRMLKRRLYDMGVTKGVRLKIKKIAPLGDPVCFELRGYELVLRLEELKNIVVRLVG